MYLRLIDDKPGGLSHFIIETSTRAPPMLKKGMQNCPQCNQPGLPRWGKFWSSMLSPMVCTLCKRPSIYRGKHLFLSVIYGHVFFYTGLVACFFVWHFWPLAVALFLTLGLNALIDAKAALEPTTPEKVNNARWGCLAYAAVFIFLVILAGVLDGWE